MHDHFQKIESTATAPCKVCNSNSYLFDVVDFNKYCSQDDYYSNGLSGIPIYYRKCEHCGLIFTKYFDDFDKQKFAVILYNNDYIKYDPDYVY